MSKSYFSAWKNSKIRQQKNHTLPTFLGIWGPKNPGPEKNSVTSPRLNPPGPDSRPLNRGPGQRRSSFPRVRTGKKMAGEDGSCCAKHEFLNGSTGEHRTHTAK
jgi:hypothetical protein